MIREHVRHTRHQASVGYCTDVRRVNCDYHLGILIISVETIEHHTRFRNTLPRQRQIILILHGTYIWFWAPCFSRP